MSNIFRFHFVIISTFTATATPRHHQGRDHWEGREGRKPCTSQHVSARHRRRRRDRSQIRRDSKSQTQTNSKWIWKLKVCLTISTNVWHVVNCEIVSKMSKFCKFCKLQRFVKFGQIKNWLPRLISNVALCRGLLSKTLLWKKRGSFCRSMESDWTRPKLSSILGKFGKLTDSYFTIPGIIFFCWDHWDPLGS
jgi:hypothetical protein